MSGTTGGCLCGAVRYTLKTPPKGVAICHCKHCQKSSGSAFTVNALTGESDLVFTGEMASYEDMGDSGNKVLRRFYSKCSSAIGGQLAARPGVFILRAGTLDDTTPLQQALFQIWTRSKQRWVLIAADIPSFEKEPG
jgi:hypothetical protein